MSEKSSEVSRIGCPNPLIYYLHSAGLAHQQLISSVLAGYAPELWSHELQIEAQSLQEQTNLMDVAEASAKRLKDMLEGIDLWRAHPYRRSITEPDPIWSNKSARLIDYGTDSAAPSVLIIPSLINRHYIMDLMEDLSFVRLLSASGLRPVLLDWGEALPDFADYSMDDYANFVLLPAFKALEEQSETKVSIAGYCMGGTLAVGLANLIGPRVHKLALLGAPWDFAAMPGVANVMRQQINQFSSEKMRVTLRGIGLNFGAVPADVFQYLFALLAPMQVVQKFSKFGSLEQSSAEAKRFVAVEDWLADGPPLPAKVAETVLIDWYTENITFNCNWSFGGELVNPENLQVPTLVVRGIRDHIVPTCVSKPLEDLIPNASSLEVNTGHVGMIVSGNAHAKIADRLSKFFCE